MKMPTSWHMTVYYYSLTGCFKPARSLLLLRVENFERLCAKHSNPKKCSIRMNAIVEQQVACPNFPQQCEMGSAQSWATQALVGKAGSP